MTPLDRIKQTLVDLIAWWVQPRIDPLALYPCTVRGQNGDGSLELVPDDSRFGPGLSRVPIRLGIPGATVQVAGGARALVSFAAGDVRKPIVVGWEAGSLDSLTITATTKVIVNAPSVVLGDEAKARPIARQGDTVSIPFPSVPGNLSGVVVGPSGPMQFTGQLIVATALMGTINGTGQQGKSA
jgi:hypothetical protein